MVVGGSLAGVEAAASLRVEGYTGELTVVGGEPGGPYERYPLSKDFLTGRLTEEELALPTQLGEDVDYRPGVGAAWLDPGERRVHLGDGSCLPYDGLVIATGSRPRRLSWVDDVGGACYFRTLVEASRVRASLADGTRRVVLVGGGLISAELGSAFVGRGHDVTVVDRAATPLTRTLGSVVAAYLRAEQQSHGVRVLAGRTVRTAVQCGGELHHLVLDDGRTLPADLVVVAAGTLPNTDWLRDSGLNAADGVGGVRCAPSLHALGSTRVVAAGDVVRATYRLLGNAAVRVPHWRNALEQARLAAANLLAGPASSRPFNAVPRYSTRMHGHHIRVVGFPQHGDQNGVLEGSVEERSLVVAAARRGRLVGIVAVDATETDLASYTALMETAAARSVKLRDLPASRAPLLEGLWLDKAFT